MTTLADLRTTADYERLEELDAELVTLRWIVRHTHGVQAVVSYQGRTYFAQQVPNRVKFDSPYRAPSGRPWFVLVELTEEQVAEEEAWREQTKYWSSQMDWGDDASRAAGRRWWHLDQGNAQRTQRLGSNRVIGRVEGYWRYG
jgi:hypothetical protein